MENIGNFWSKIDFEIEIEIFPKIFEIFEKMEIFEKFRKISKIWNFSIQIPLWKISDFPKNPMIFLSKNSNFYSSDLHKNWKLFFNDPETFISAILASWAKIRVPPGYHFWSRIFKKSQMAVCTTPLSDEVRQFGQGIEPRTAYPISK